MCVCKEVKLLSNSISRNFAKIAPCLRDMTNLADIFETSELNNQPQKWKSFITR